MARRESPVRDSYRRPASPRLTDAYGRFHITCAITPREGRGSNFMLKLDNRSLPTGYRGSTDAFQIERATRGKALHFSFGASIHKVIGLDIADAVFVPDSTEMRPQWRPRVNLLLEELQKGPAVLRLSYLADVEDPKLVEQRVDAMTQLVSTRVGRSAPQLSTRHRTRSVLAHRQTAQRRLATLGAARGEPMKRLNRIRCSACGAWLLPLAACGGHCRSAPR